MLLCIGWDKFRGFITRGRDKEFGRKEKEEGCKKFKKRDWKYSRSQSLNVNQI